MSINDITNKIKKENIEYDRRNMVVTKPSTKFEVYDPNGIYYDLDISEWNTGYIDKDGSNVPDLSWKSTLIPDVNIQSATNVYYKGSLTGNLGGIWIIDTVTLETYFYNAGIGNTVNSLLFTIDPGTYYIGLSYYVDNPNKLPFSLSIAQFERVDVSRYVTNQTDLEVVMKRKDLSGIMTEISFPVVLSGLGRSLFKYLFDTFGVYFRSGFDIFKRHRNSNQYDLLKQFKISCVSYVEKKDVVEIQCFDPSIQGLINAYSKTKYDISVSGITESKKFNYGRITLPSTSNYTPAEVVSQEIPGSRYLFPLSFTNIELAPDAKQHIGRSQEIVALLNETTDEKCFFVAADDVDVRLHYGFRVSISKFRPVKQLMIWKFIPAVINPDTQAVITPASISFIYSKDLDQYDSSTGEYYTQVSFENMPISLLKGEGLYIGINADIDPSNKFTFRLSNTQPFYVQWFDRGQPLDIDVIKPESLLQAFIDKMSGVEGKFNSQIYWKDKDYKLLLSAAESIRGFNDAKIHGSFNDFINWMRAFGYERGFDGNTVFFKPRDDYYNKDITAIELKETELADLIIRVDQDVIYSNIKVGYPKIDYSQAGGRYEFNSEFSYTTGFDTGELDTTNTLELLSPYRGDSMGVEFLTWERLKETTDDKSDSDIFVLSLTENSEDYTIYEGNTATIGEVELFNGVINPRNLALENESLIGITTKTLTFTATTGSNGVTIDGIPFLYGSVPINKKLFDPIIYDFATGAFVDLPDKDKQSGLIRFQFKGIVYQGFIDEIRKNYNRGTETTWILYGVK